MRFARANNEPERNFDIVFSSRPYIFFLRSPLPFSFFVRDATANARPMLIRVRIPRVYGYVMVAVLPSIAAWTRIYAQFIGNRGRAQWIARRGVSRKTVLFHVPVASTVRDTRSPVIGVDRLTSTRAPR